MPPENKKYIIPSGLNKRIQSEFYQTSGFNCQTVGNLAEKYIVQYEHAMSKMQNKQNCIALKRQIVEKDCRWGLNNKKDLKEANLGIGEIVHSVKLCKHKKHKFNP